METDKFCLKWNDFASNLGSSLQDLRRESNLFDVTLMCGDSSVIQAHKLVLSACSPIFRNIFTSQQQHPLIYLRGVSSAELSAVLSFIYYGEVNVATEDLKSFLAVAEDLKIKGLTEQNQQSDNNRNHSAKIKSKSPEKISTPSTGSSNMSSLKIRDVVSMNSSASHNYEVSQIDDDVIHMNTDYGEESQVQQDYYEEDYVNEDVVNVMENGGNQDEIIDAMIESILIKKNSPVLGTIYECSVCQKQLKKKDKMQAHAEIHLKGFSHVCPTCNKTYKTRPSLKVHISTNHKVKVPVVPPQNVSILG